MIILSTDHRFLYAVNEIATYGPNKSGSITAYAVDPTSGAPQAAQYRGFRRLHSLLYQCPDPSGKFLLVANYTGGSYSVIRLKPDGSLGETTDVVKPDGPDERL